MGSSTIQNGDATHYGCLELGSPSGFSYLYGTTTSPFYVATTSKPSWCE